MSTLPLDRETSPTSKRNSTSQFDLVSRYKTETVDYPTTRLLRTSPNVH